MEHGTLMYRKSITVNCTLYEVSENMFKPLA